MSVNTIVCANALHLPYADESVNCVVTSPPYYGLREYNVPGQLGLEDAPATYIERIVAVFREARRVLRDDGVAWVNLGDSYNNDCPTRSKSSEAFEEIFSGGKISDGTRRSSRTSGLKPKDLMMMPARVAIALQNDGWYLRSEIVWAKPNPMPESVSDRPTKAHEMVYLLTKSPRYFYDAEAIREPNSDGSNERFGIGPNGSTRKWDTDNNKRDGRIDGTKSNEGFRDYVPNGRNRRSVWTVATEPTPFAHFATFPRKLIEPMILAGCPDKVCCQCGKPWVRVTEKSTSFEGGSGKAGRTAAEVNASGKWAGKQYGTNIKLGPVVSISTTGFRPTCKCDAPHRPGVVLDPFMGSGTVAVVARKLGRDYIGCDLNPAYIDIARERLRLPFEEHHIEQSTRLDDLPLFVSLKGND